MKEYIEKSIVERMLWAVIMAKDERTIEEMLEYAPTVNAIPISDNATNGDMIKALFPNYEETRMCRDVRYGSKEYYNLEFVIDEDWWDAPYKEE